MNLKISNNLKKAYNMFTSGVDGSKKGSELGFYAPTADDLSSGKKSYMTPATDMLDKKNPLNRDDSIEEKAKYFAKDMTIEEMKEYARRHTSGKKLDTMECIAGGGRIASFEKFVEMVNEGYNIVKADVLGYDMIDVVFQKKMDESMRMRGR